MKSDDAQEGVQLAHVLATLSEARQNQLSVEGGDNPISALQQQLPQTRVVSKAIIESCVLQYIALGWSGYVPGACRHIELLLPDQFAPRLWGWPYRFLERMEANDTHVILEKGDGTEEFSSGFDTPADLQSLPPGYNGGIWTNRIDRVGPVLHQK